MADKESTTPQRRRIDIATMLCGIATLLASAYVLTDGAIWIPSLDPRWLLAGGALVVAAFLLIGTFRGRRRSR